MKFSKTREKSLFLVSSSSSALYLSPIEMEKFNKRARRRAFLASSRKERERERRERERRERERRMTAPPSVFLLFCCCLFSVRRRAQTHTVHAMSSRRTIGAIKKGKKGILLDEKTKFTQGSLFFQISVVLKFIIQNSRLGPNLQNHAHKFREGPMAQTNHSSHYYKSREFSPSLA